MSSIYTYAQDTDLPYVKGLIDRAHTDAPMFVSFFRYSIGFWPESIARMMGNLVQYRRESGHRHAPAHLTLGARSARDGWLLRGAREPAGLCGGPEGDCDVLGRGGTHETFLLNPCSAHRLQEPRPRARTQSSSRWH